MIKGEVDKVQRYFFIITARGTGKTTTLLKMLGYFCWNFPFVINIVKKTWGKALEFVDQLQEIMANDYGVSTKFNQSKRRMEFGQSIIRVFTLNKEHMKQKEVPTGISIEYTKKAVINIVDECSPDIDYGLWSVFEQSQKAGEDKIPKTTFFMSNPWVRGDYFISKWFKEIQWTRHDGMTEPYYKIVNDGKSTFIGASLFANPMCPSTDLQTYWDTTEYNKNQRDIVIFGIPGASNGQVFDNFYKMQFFHVNDDFNFYIGGIDVGWTTVAGDGGATTLELFKYHAHEGLEGVLEYYHHNKDGMIDSSKQQTYMLERLFVYLSRHTDHKPCTMYVDVGADTSIAGHIAEEWMKTYGSRCEHSVFFLPVTYSMKQHWRLKDRYDWINVCLAMNKILVSLNVQPHLAQDLESAVYKDATVNVEKDPQMDHSFSDTIMALCYAGIGYYKTWLTGWKLWEKKKQQIQRNEAKFQINQPTNNQQPMNATVDTDTKSTSAMTKPTENLSKALPPLIDPNF